MDAFQILVVIGLLIAIALFFSIFLNSINTDIDEDAEIENGNKSKKSIPVN
jgi:hypothetical protein